MTVMTPARCRQQLALGDWVAVQIASGRTITLCHTPDGYRITMVSAYGLRRMDPETYSDETSARQRSRKILLDQFAWNDMRQSYRVYGQRDGAPFEYTGQTNT